MKLPLALSFLALASCNSMSSRSAVQIVDPASDSERAALLDKVKSLEGTWESKGPDGAMHVSSVFTVSSGGNAVREVMVPGTPYEMTNMYTMDGRSLLMTHYCAMGNQPHMRATAGSPANVLRFEPAGVSNLTKGQGYMGSMVLTIVDKDHLKTEWHHIGMPGEEAPTVFELTRRK